MSLTRPVLDRAMAGTTVRRHMDEHRFDTLTRSLVASGSRRGALRLLVSLGLGGTLIPLGAERAAAQCGLVRTSTQRASRCSRRNSCCENARCKNKRCKCKPEWCDTDDDGLCETQLGTDAACKACDDACDEFQSCRGVFGTRFKDCCRPLGQVCELGQCCFERRSAPWGAGSHASEAATTAGMCGSTCSAQRAPGEGRLRRRD
jgi:hypothetical protein